MSFSLEDILSTHQQLIGSYEGGTISTVWFEGILVEGETNVDPFIIQMKKPSFIRVNARFGPSSYVEGFNGDIAWEQRSPNAPKVQLSEIPYQTLNRSITFPNVLVSFTDFRSNGHLIQYKGIEKIDKKEYYVLTLSAGDDLRDYFLNQSSFLIERIRDKRKLEPDEDPVIVETLFDEYKNFEGIDVACHQKEIALDSGELLTSITWKKILFNLEFSDDLFTF